MARPSYRGPVHTLEQARLADLPVRLICGECGHFQQMHAFALLQKLSEKRRPGPINLLEPLPGFYCKGCKRSVRAVISAPILAA